MQGNAAPSGRHIPAMQLLCRDLQQLHVVHLLTGDAGMSHPTRGRVTASVCCAWRCCDSLGGGRLQTLGTIASTAIILA